MRTFLEAMLKQVFFFRLAIRNVLYRCNNGEKGDVSGKTRSGDKLDDANSSVR